MLVTGTADSEHPTLLSLDTTSVVVHAVSFGVHPIGFVLIPAHVGGEGATMRHAHLGEVDQLFHRAALWAEPCGVNAEQVEHGIHQALEDVALLWQSQSLE